MYHIMYVSYVKFCMSNSRGICEVRKTNILILILTLDTDDDGDVGGDNQITEKSICKGDGKAAELMQSAIRDITEVVNSYT